jgi:hypothetical protein
MAVTTFDIDKKTAQKLEELKVHFGASSKAEVLRKAIALLNIASNLEASDGSITIRKDGNDQKVILK